MVLVGIICVAAVVIEVAAVTNVFGLLNHSTTAPTGPSGPNLNPYNEVFITLKAEIVYLGTGHGYFAQLENQPICGARCGADPIQYNQYEPPQIGLAFYFNVTNAASVRENMSEPVLGMVGANTEGFVLETFCCYTTTNQPYTEALSSGLQFTPSGGAGATVGLKAYIYTTVAIPQNAAGGYSFFFNVTSD